MAGTTVKSSFGQGIRLVVNVDADAATKTFKKARRLIRREFHQILLESANEVVVPHAKVLAGNLKIKGRSTSAMIVARRGSYNSVYLTSRTRGQLGRAFGLQEVGGTLGPVVPKAGRKGAGGHAPALKTPRGFFARTTGVRVYTGRRFLAGAVHAELGHVTDVAMRRLMHAFDPLEHTP